MTMRFRNRVEAGQLLAKRLGKYANRSDVLVLALPRGGVPVGYEYEDFSQTTDAEVRELLQRASQLSSPT